MPEPEFERPAPSEDPDVTRTYVRGLARHLTVTPIGHILEADLKDGLRRALAAQHAAIEAFIEGKLAEGLSLQEINEFSAVQMQVMPTLVERNGHRKLEWPFKIIGPDD
ncbi:hypothetical protein [Neorhizobium tomejilense]|uniref:hypothetical protein n=1 Tax=Neorhizobium tomejilense TaxID=2093828 RepID=UPI003ED15BDA